MFLKSLLITKNDNELIRAIPFHLGMNLIVDHTVSFDTKETGNNVGKTTTLRLIDYCLGGNAKDVYTDPENNKNEYKLVKDFLITNNVLVSLKLKRDLNNEESEEIIIERNFLSRKKKIQKINGIDMNEDAFEEALTNVLIPNHYGKKPTFRQIISHNLRHKDISINNTIKNINQYTRDDEYEALYLFLLGCDFSDGEEKQALRTKIDLEEKFKKRLENEQTKSAYETALYLLNIEIEDLENKKDRLVINPNFESDFQDLNDVKYQINLASSKISELNLRKSLILEAKYEMENKKSNIDFNELREIYNQASPFISKIQRTFEELCEFHNKMIDSKLNFITQELPSIESKISIEKDILKHLLNEENKLSALVVRSDSFEALEIIIGELNLKHQKKGEYENLIKQINNVEIKLTELNVKLSSIDTGLFSDDFHEKIKAQVTKFNKYFSFVSNEIYGEKYALKVDVKTKKNNKSVYEFTSFNTNFSSGKKQGEISCFDIAYTLFADDENIPCMHFLLNDKKELMHDNQLVMINNFIENKNIQYVVSILNDKLPSELNSDKYICLKLSQNNKLFKI